MTKEKNAFKIGLMLVVVLLGITLLVVRIINSFPVDMKNTSYTSLKVLEDYFIEDLSVVEECQSDTVDTKYLVSFVDKNGQRVYAEMEVRTDSEFDRKCKAYVQEGHFYLGDAVLFGCFRGIKNYEESEKLSEAYERVNAEIQGAFLNWNFRYEFATKREYVQSTEPEIGLLLACALILLGVIGIIKRARERKHLLPEDLYEIQELQGNKATVFSDGKIDSSEVVINQTGKEDLYKKLDGFLYGNYLKEVYSGDDFSVFRFMKKIYVGFLHQLSDEEVPVGVMFTKAEAKLIIHTKSSDALGFLYGEEDSVIVLTDEMLSLCKSFWGRCKISRMLSNRYFIKATTCMVDEESLKAVQKMEMVELIQVNRFVKEELVQRYLMHKKKVKKMFGSFLIVALLAILSGVAIKWCKKYDPEKSAMPFDRNLTDFEYVSVEIDFLTPLMELYTTNSEKADYSMYGTYYLFGNSQNGTYGIAKLDQEDRQQLLEDDEIAKRYETGIRLYGDMRSLFNWKSWIKMKESMEKQGFLWDDPHSGTECKDYTAQAISLFAENLFVIDSDADLGTGYLDASLVPETNSSFLSNAMMLIAICCAWIGMVLLFLSWFRLMAFSGYEEELISYNQGKMIKAMLLGAEMGNNE